MVTRCEVRPTIPMPEYSNERIVRAFRELDADDVDVAGGKGANLAALARPGLPVPRGFVVTTAAYRRLVESPQIRDAIDRLDALDSADADALTAAAAELRSLVESRELDAAVEAAIADATASFERADSFAVRSSSCWSGNPGIE